MNLHLGYACRRISVSHQTGTDQNAAVSKTAVSTKQLTVNVKTRLTIRQVVVEVRDSLTKDVVFSEQYAGYVTFATAAAI